MSARAKFSIRELNVLSHEEEMEEDATSNDEEEKDTKDVEKLKNIYTAETSTTPEKFEAKLRAEGYVLTTGDKSCRHPKNLVFYIQDDTEGVPERVLRTVSETFLPWAKSLYCEKCLAGRLDGLYCGGHYHNLRFFRNGVPNLDEYEGVRPLVPEKILWTEEGYEPEEETVEEFEARVRERETPEERKMTTAELIEKYRTTR